MKKTLLIVFIFFSQSVVFATAISSIQNGAWNDINTWAGGIIPGNTDDVTILHDITVSNSSTANALTFGNTGTLVVGSSSTLTIATGTTDLNQNGNSLTIDAGASMIKTNGDFVVSATASVTINGSLDVQNGDYTVTNGLNSTMSVGINGALNISGNFIFSHSNQTINILGDVTLGTMTTGGDNITFIVGDDATFNIINSLVVIATQHFTVTGTLNVGSINVTGGNPIYEIGAGGTLNVDGDFTMTNSGTLNISDPTGTAIIGGDMNMYNGGRAHVDGALVIIGDLYLQYESNRITGTGTVSAATADCPDDNCGIGSEDDITLPVTLHLFELVVVNETKVKIAWQTSSEINNDYFMLYKSTDGVHFDVLATLDGYGTTNEIINYEYVDQVTGRGAYYYYLKQVDFDGKSEIFNTKKITLNSNLGIVDIVYPSPANHNADVFVRANPIDKTTLKISLFDVTASRTKQLSYQYEGSVIRLNTSQLNLNSGLYLIKISYDQQTYTKRLIIK
ncbi:MAG: T9SS type A sorting domain-containing protein [Reichenbachiella sp.]